MTFYTVYKEQPFEGYCRSHTFLAAKTIILKYHFGAAEAILDKYCIDWDYWYDEDWYDDYYYPVRTTEIESICDDPEHILCSFCPLYDEKNNRCLGNSTRFAEMQVIKKAEDDFINDFFQRLL